MLRVLTALALSLAVGRAAGQNFHYIEPGAASCPAAPAATAAAPKSVPLGAPVRGRLHVACGFDKGSYTVTVNATDAGATITPKTFIVNFGRLVGSGAFTVRFATPGVHSVSAAITSNMGSPAVRGRFESADNGFQVVPR